jgi:hypothetical protein
LSVRRCRPQSHPCQPSVSGSVHMVWQGVA